MTTPTPEELLISLKKKAEMLGITFHPSIGYDKLKEKVDEKLAEQPKEDPVDAGQIPKLKSKREVEREVRDRASKLTRVMITSRDPNKKDWPGEIISAGNSTVGFFKKYIPFGTEWHVPQVILNALAAKKVQTFIPKIDSKGNKTKVGRLINAYNIEVLPPLTPQELQDLGKAQAASGRLED